MACLVVGLIFDDDKGFSRIIDIFLTLGLNIFAFAWCRNDAGERGYKLHRFFSYAVVILGTLALLYYLFRSRGFRRGLVSTGWLVLYVILCFGISMIIAAALVLIAVFAGVVPGEILD